MSMKQNQRATSVDPEIPLGRQVRIRISVRALMGLVLVIGLGLGWYIHLVREQHSAVQAILERGGTVEYDYKYDATGNRRLRKARSWSPAWLQNAVGGDDFFHHVGVVGLDLEKSGNRVRPTDEDMRHFEGFNHLKVLYLGGGRITDAGLERLKNLTDLRMLVLWGNPISGAGLKHLRGLIELGSQRDRRD
jgi:hypothetical protein